LALGFETVTRGKHAYMSGDHKCDIIHHCLTVFLWIQIQCLPATTNVYLCAGLSH